MNADTHTHRETTGTFVDSLRMGKFIDIPKTEIDFMQIS